MARLRELKALLVLNSKANWTLKVTAISGLYQASAVVPGGTSAGIHEVKTIEVSKAVRRVKFLSKKLSGSNLKEIDSLIAKEAGNVSTGISIACHKLMAKVKGKEYYELLGGNRLPVAFMNIINGGAHAGNGLAFQEYMIAPRARTFSDSLSIGVEVYHELRKYLVKKYGRSAVNVGLEGGFAPPLISVEAPLKILSKIINKLGYSKQVGLALDVAASQFYKKGKYLVDGKRLSINKLKELYESLVDDYKLISIEDPFFEEDFDSFSELAWSLKNKVQVVGDDLTVSNPERVRQAIREHSCNCLLLKVNQVGSVSKAIEAASLARRHGWKVMVSHRSGDSCDSFISDLAVGLNTGLIKTGAPARGERVAKYNRLLEIEEQLGSKANF